MNKLFKNKKLIILFSIIIIIISHSISFISGYFLSKIITDKDTSVEEEIQEEGTECSDSPYIEGNTLGQYDKYFIYRIEKSTNTSCFNDDETYQLWISNFENPECEYMIIDIKDFITNHGGNYCRLQDVFVTENKEAKYYINSLEASGLIIFFIIDNEIWYYRTDNKVFTLFHNLEDNIPLLKDYPEAGIKFENIFENQSSDYMVISIGHYSMDICDSYYGEGAEEQLANCLVDQRKVNDDINSFTGFYTIGYLGIIENHFKMTEN